MKIAIASGKGGTGKTTVATNLAYALAAQGESVAYLDCDVEEPNGHLFLRPETTHKSEVTIPVPQVDQSVCRLGTEGSPHAGDNNGGQCRACSQVCRYSGILALGQQVLTFPKLCHGCGACALVCPERAIREVPRPIGTLELGHTADHVAFLQGTLAIGEAMSPPVIRAALRATPPADTVIVDAPPGTSCPVIESVKTADVVALVTEPTPFGLSDLKLAVAMVRTLGLPFGVVINRADVGDKKVLTYCQSEKIPVLLQIADNRRIAETYSRGALFAKTDKEFCQQLTDLYSQLQVLARTPRPKPADISTPAEVSVSVPEPQSPANSSGDNGNGSKEIVVISGKGGTGKTSIVASLFALSQDAALADCDVDAANLHLVLEPQIQQQQEFSGGYEARIDADTCIGCGMCQEYCRFDAISASSHGNTAMAAFSVDGLSCEGCGVCALVCPAKAVEMVPTKSGSWFISETRHGPLTHARLGIAQENSGKLVSTVRRESRAVASSRGRDLLLIDGAPGIGCPVISSITGADLALVVTEPTCSGWHDLRRVLELTRHFGIKTAVCINKADINPDLTDQICRDTENYDVPVLGQIRYDTAVTRAQVQGRAVVEDRGSLAAEDIRELWQRIGNL